MKVKFTKEMKRIITVAEMPMVRKIIEDLKHSDDDVMEYAEMAACLAGDSNVVKILNATASIAKNCRVHDQFCEDSGDLDVWIEFTAYVYGYHDKFLICGVYLTDVWKIGPRESNEYVKEHMFIRTFTENK